MLLRFARRLRLPTEPGFPIPDCVGRILRKVAQLSAERFNLEVRRETMRH